MKHVFFPLRIVTKLFYIRLLRKPHASPLAADTSKRWPRTFHAPHLSLGSRMPAATYQCLMALTVACVPTLGLQSSYSISSSSLLSLLRTLSYVVHNPILGHYNIIEYCFL